MSIQKAIEIKITRVTAAVTHLGSGEVVYHQTVVTREFAPAYAGDIIKSVCGCDLDDDDHGDLNNLHAMGKMSSRFGKDWEFYVEAVVTYPDDVQSDDQDEFARTYQNKL